MQKLTCSNLTKVYKGGNQALDSVSFSIPSNGIFALIGRNGAGKTTLIRILATQLLPTSGKVVLNGIDVVKDPNSLRVQIAAVPQETRPVMWLSPKQQIVSYLLWRGVGYKEAGERAVKALKKLGITKYADIHNEKLSIG